MQLQVELQNKNFKGWARSMPNDSDLEQIADDSSEEYVQIVNLDDEDNNQESQHSFSYYFKYAAVPLTMLGIAYTALQSTISGRVQACMEGVQDSVFGYPEEYIASINSEVGIGIGSSILVPIGMGTTLYFAYQSGVASAANDNCCAMLKSAGNMLMSMVSGTSAVYVETSILQPMFQQNLISSSYEFGYQTLSRRACKDYSEVPQSTFDDIKVVASALIACSIFATACLGYRNERKQQEIDDRILPLNFDFR